MHLARTGHGVDKENSLFATETLRFTTHAPLLDVHRHRARLPNALREGVDAKATITLKYGPYMN